MFSGKIFLVAVLTAWPFGAYAQSGMPLSPYGDDREGVYDYASKCWVWDHGSTGKTGAGYQFITDSRCDAQWAIAFDGPWRCSLGNEFQR